MKDTNFLTKFNLFELRIKYVNLFNLLNNWCWMEQVIIVFLFHMIQREYNIRFT